jgi:hypothetical protein
LRTCRVASGEAEQRAARLALGGRGFQPLRPRASLARALLKGAAMKHVLWVMLTVATAAGCASECDDANDHMASCGFDDVYHDGDCSDKDGCIALCIIGSSCDSIDDQSGYYAACIDQC